MTHIVITREFNGRNHTFCVWRGEELAAEFLLFGPARGFAVRTARNENREAYATGQYGKQVLFRPSFSKVSQ